MLTRLIASLLLIAPLFAFQIENAVYPLMHQVENIDNLEPSKYSKAQFNAIAQGLADAHSKIRLMSYNVLFDLQDDTLESSHKWPQRHPYLAYLIQLINPDILCVQELQDNQLSDLIKSLGQEYDFYGNIETIFFKKTRFTLKEKKTLLIGKGHALTYLLLFDNIRRTTFAVYNTHLPYCSAESRYHSMQDLLDHLDHTDTAVPIVLAGDFNTIPQKLDRPGLPFYDGDYLQQMIKNKGLFSTMDHPLLGHIGPISTYTNGPQSNNGIPFVGTGVPGIILDHVFVSESINVLIHAIEPARIESHFPSDHMPVIVDMVMP